MTEPLGGYIRFVGGSHHNKHHLIPDWLPLISVPSGHTFPVPLRFDSRVIIAQMPEWKLELYNLTEWISLWGTHFFEYTLRGVDPGHHTQNDYFWPVTVSKRKP